MIPDYIRDEIKHRLRTQDLHRSKAKAICRMLGIDLVQTLETFRTIEDTVAELREFHRAGEVHEGAVWFQFETMAHGSLRHVRGRMVFATTPYEADGTRGHLVTDCQVLVWRFGESAPIWQPIPEDMLPPDLIEAAYQEIDALALTQSTDCQSNA